MRPLSLLVLGEKVSGIVFEITMGKNIHRAWVSRVRKAGMIVRSVDNGREDNEEIVREREVHTRWEGREGIIGVAVEMPNVFFVFAIKGEQLDWRGTKTKQLRRDSFIVLSTKETTSHIS